MFKCIITTKWGKQAEKGRTMSFHKVTYFFIDISKNFFMQLNELEDLEKLFVMLRDRIFVGSTAKQGHCNVSHDTGN